MDITKPLAYRLRPKNLDDIVGQDHIVGKNGIIRRMLNNNKFFSLILYGEPGIGKTTIATVVSNVFEFNHYKFNASTDKKSKLQSITENAKLYGGTLLIIDEIHRMKKDIQDFLLPYIEEGVLTIIGLTTNNPYHSVNPAIRSRCHIIRLKRITEHDIKSYLIKLKNDLDEYSSVNINDDVYSYIAQMSNGEIRTAINMLEILLISTGNENIDMDFAVSIIQIPSLSLDKKSNNYYDILSAFHKSIRGSDVNAAIHYLARLIVLEDLDSICRRLLAIAYEDIALANPDVCPRTVAACQAARELGFPEAKLPLSTIVIDLALSPKSNSAVVSINSALADIESGMTYKIPSQIINTPTYDSKRKYIYPHDYLDALVKQQYLPNELKDKIYYVSKHTGKYERALHMRNEIIKNFNTKK